MAVSIIRLQILRGHFFHFVEESLPLRVEPQYVGPSCLWKEASWADQYRQHLWDSPPNLRQPASEGSAS